MQERANAGVAFSHMSATAALSVLALLVLAGWQLVSRFASPALVATSTSALGASSSPASGGNGLAALASTTEAIASTSDPIAEASASTLGQLLGTYAGFESQGTYSTSTADSLAYSMGYSQSVPVTYQHFTLMNITTATDTSYDGMLAYRKRLQVALKPLLNNKESELDLFAQYVQTKDPSYLSQLTAAAQNYFAAASSTEQVAVPVDAATIQLDMMNAMERFGATLQAMVVHAQDPLAEAMLLNNYNTAEQNMLASFNELVQYEKAKQAQ